jgi:hypothetical protein
MSCMRVLSEQVCPRVFMPTGFRTVGNTWAGVADDSLVGMGWIVEEADGAMGGMVENAVPDQAEELCMIYLDIP